MNHFAGIDGAREHARKNGLTTGSVIEFVHPTQGTRYLACKVSLAVMDKALAAKPMAEIKRLVAEHAIEAPEATEARKRDYRKHNCKCERCGTQVDGNTAYNQIERGIYGKVTAWYCESCRQLLQAIGAGEHTDMQLRANEAQVVEPYTKSDR